MKFSDNVHLSNYKLNVSNRIQAEARHGSTNERHGGTYYRQPGLHSKFPSPKLKGSKYFLLLCQVNLLSKA